MCYGFEFPVDAKNHIIRFDPVALGGGLLHHMVLYSVPSATWYHEFHPCWGMPGIGAQPMYAWAPGGDQLELPAVTGMAVGNSYVKYAVLQIHYDNPTKIEGKTDSSGVRMWLTTQLRQYDSGFLFFGINNRNINIPPKSENWHSAGVCPASQTQPIGKTPLGRLEIFSVANHQHLSGYQMWTEVVRNTSTGLQKVAEFGKDLDFDFNAQKFVNVNFTVLPGDTFITRCVWSTTDKTKPIFGGESTTQEMCLQAVLYYPHLDTSRCTLAFTPGISCAYPCAAEDWEAVLENAVPNGGPPGGGPRPWVKITLFCLGGVAVLAASFGIIYWLKRKPRKTEYEPLANEDGQI